MWEMQKHKLTPEADLRQPSTSQGCSSSSRAGQLATMLSHNRCARENIYLLGNPCCIRTAIDSGFSSHLSECIFDSFLSMSRLNLTHAWPHRGGEVAQQLDSAEKDGTNTDTGKGKKRCQEPHAPLSVAWQVVGGIPDGHLGHPSSLLAFGAADAKAGCFFCFCFFARRMAAPTMALAGYY